MDAKILPLFFLVLLAGLVLAQNSNPVIDSVSASDLTIKSGEYVSLEVIASDPDNQPLTFDWDFGDGATASGQNVLHVYTIKPDLYKTFTVTLTASDGTGGEAVKTLDINVTPADFLVKFVSPSQTQAFEKGGLMPVKVELVDPLGRPLSSYQVFEVKAVFLNKEIDLQPADGFFEGNFDIPYSIGESAPLFIEASATPIHTLAGSSTMAFASFSPAELQAKLSFEPTQVFDGSTVTRVKVELLYPDNSRVKNAVVSGRLEQSNLSFTERPFYYEATGLRHVFREGQSNQVILYARDPYGNQLTDFSQQIQATAVKPEEPQADGGLLYFLGIALVVIVLLVLVFVGLNLMLHGPEEVKSKIEAREPAKKPKAGKPAKSKWTFSRKAEAAESEKLDKLNALFRETALKEKIAEDESGVKVSEKEKRALELDSLVDSLRPFKDRFTAEEIMAAAIGQGLDKKTALELARRVKGGKK